MSRPSMRPVVFGEVLFDRFADGQIVLGGAPFNVAWNLQAFGQAPLFVSRVGDDELGARIHAEMTRWGMDTSMLQVDTTHATGVVDVGIRAGEPEYTIVADRAYDYIEPSGFDALAPPALIYHGSLAMRSAMTRSSFDRLVTAVAAPRFLDVNLRAPWWNVEQIKSLIDGARWVKLNEQELVSLGPEYDSSEQSAERARRVFGVDTIVLTRGAAGAVLLDASGAIAVQPRSATRQVDSVGAGDAFASVMLLGLLAGWSSAVTLERAQTFASGVVGLRGATVGDRGFYADYLESWSREPRGA